MKTLIALSLIGLLSFTSSVPVYKGTIAPEITLLNPEGVKTSLSSLKGKIVFIDFWASWCKPCRMRHPEVVKMYHQFKEAKFKNASGFDIFSVSLDNNKSAWTRAIQQDKLEWKNHVSELKGWKSSFVSDYGIRGIPFNVLLDAEGAVIATNLHGEQLTNTLKALQ